MRKTNKGIRAEKESRERLKIAKALDSIIGEKTKHIHKSNRARTALLNELKYLNSLDY